MIHKIETLQDIYTPWKPIDSVEPVSKFLVDGLHDDAEGFRILLRAEDPTQDLLRIKFENHLSYRNTDESYLLSVWDSIEKNLLGTQFFLVEQSSYIEFLHQMTGNIYEDLELIHYAIYTTSDCIDVITQQSPYVSWV